MELFTGRKFGGVLFFFVVLWMEPKAVCTLGNWSTTELHPQPLSGIIHVKGFTQSKHSLNLICLSNPESIY